MALTGLVKWYDNKKGFGIIIDDETKEEVFAHYTNIKSSGNFEFAKLIDNQIVTFDIHEEKGKTCARNIDASNIPNDLTNISFYNNSGKGKDNNSGKGGGKYNNSGKVWGTTNRGRDECVTYGEYSRNKCNNNFIKNNSSENLRNSVVKTTTSSPWQPNGKLPNRRRNTTNFKPSYEPVDMRIVIENNNEKYTREVTSRDVILIKDFFKKEENIYEKLNTEIKNSGLKNEDLWKSWHGDSHFIADDHINWKDKCPTFQDVLTKIAYYFDMNIQATRLNFYNNSKEWKPFHHDAAAIDEEKANTQNITVAVSFGLEREVAFQHAKNYSLISTPVEDGSIYVFCKDVNIIWKHGIRQMNEDDYIDKGRYSIIVWGWRKMIQY